MITRKETSSHDITSYINKNNLSNKLLPFSCIVRQDGSILDCSKDFLNILGYTSSELIGKSLFDFVDINNVTAMFESLDSQTKIQHGKIILRKKDGTYISFSARIKNSTFRSKPVVTLIFIANSGNYNSSGEK